MEIDQYTFGIIIVAYFAYAALDIYLGHRLIKKMQQPGELENRLFARPRPLGPVGLCLKVNELRARAGKSPIF